MGKLLIVIGIALMTFSAMYLWPHNVSSYAKGFQVRQHTKLWRV